MLWGAKLVVVLFLACRAMGIELDMTIIMIVMPWWLAIWYKLMNFDMQGVKFVFVLNLLMCGFMLMASDNDLKLYSLPIPLMAMVYSIVILKEKESYR